MYIIEHHAFCSSVITFSCCLRSLVDAVKYSYSAKRTERNVSTNGKYIGDVFFVLSCHSENHD